MFFEIHHIDLILPQRTQRTQRGLLGAIDARAGELWTSRDNTMSTSSAIPLAWYDLGMNEIAQLLPSLRELHDRIRQSVLEATAVRSSEDLSRIVADEGGDLVFAIDRVSEKVLIDFVTNEIACHTPVVLIAEGLPTGKIILPAGTREEDCLWRIIVDPIDGTRCLMYQKRPGWILTGVAPNLGSQTNLSDIQLAVQTEIPLLKQHLSDQLWAIRGQGTTAERFNRITGQREPLELQPSTADTIRNGYAAVTRFFPGTRDVLAEIDDELVKQILGQHCSGSSLTFEDQYASTGGQVYCLASGADRLIADIRPLMRPIAEQRQETMGHCCHPYDICTALVATELGVEITAPDGRPLEVPLDVDSDVAWVGYANSKICKQVEPSLQEILRDRELI